MPGSSSSSEAPDDDVEPDADVEPDPLDRSELLVQPAEMQLADGKGAIAAAKYSMSLFEYVYLTGDLEVWEDTALPGCDFCDVVSRRAREMHAAGNYRVSGPPEWIGTPKVKRVPTLQRWDVTLRAVVSASTTFGPDGNVESESPSGESMVKIAMRHDGEGWKTVDIRIFDVEH